MTNQNYQSLDMDYFKQIAERRNRRIETERSEALRKKNEPKQETPEIKAPEQEAQRIITPSEIKNPEDYLLLEGKNEKNYSYADTFVSKQTYHKNKNWRECHELLQKDNAYMPTIRQFVDFLSMLKSGKAFDGSGKKVDKKELERLFLDITEIRSPYRAEWLDADFKVKSGKLHINYNHDVSKGNLIPGNSEPLEACLMDNKTPGIDLDSWLKNNTYQGLPKSSIKLGSLYYWAPANDNNSVARFSAGSDWASLYCGRNPDILNAGLGVRLARSEAPKQSPKNSASVNIQNLEQGFEQKN